MPPHYLSSVFYLPRNPRDLHSFPTRRSSDLPSFVNITPKSVASNMRPESRSTATSNTGRSTAGLRSQLAPPSRLSYKPCATPTNRRSEYPGTTANPCTRNWLLREPANLHVSPLLSERYNPPPTIQA